MSIAYPFKIITLSSRNNSLIAIVILIILSGFSTAPRFFEIQIRERPPVEIYVSKEDLQINQCMFYNLTNVKLRNYIRPSGISCSVVCGCSPVWANRPTNRFWYHIVIETSIKFIFPFLLLLGFNMGIIRNLVKTYKFRSKQTKSKRPTAKDALRRHLSVISNGADRGKHVGRLS